MIDIRVNTTFGIVVNAVIQHLRIVTRDDSVQIVVNDIPLSDRVVIDVNSKTVQVAVHGVLRH